MKKTIQALLSATLLIAAAGAVQAAGHAGAPMAAPAAASASSASAMADGEIRKVDKATKKITIKHGEIKNLDMPGMTMVFGVKDAALLDKIKAGDKVKFSAEKEGSAIIVTDIQMAK
jgi:Cu/Ag efflux protein CusF